MHIYRVYIHLKTAGLDLEDADGDLSDVCVDYFGPMDYSIEVYQI